jgi:hypothetical protein
MGKIFEKTNVLVGKRVKSSQKEPAINDNLNGDEFINVLPKVLFLLLLPIRPCHIHVYIFIDRIEPFGPAMKKVYHIVNFHRDKSDFHKILKQIRVKVL